VVSIAYWEEQTSTGEETDKRSFLSLRPLTTQN
jgi:hypothetical protein